MASQRKKLRPSSTTKSSIDEIQLQLVISTEPDRVEYKEFGRKVEFQVFERVLVDKLGTDFVICVSCNDHKLIKYDTNTGSNPLNRHLEKPFHVNKLHRIKLRFNVV